jgi:hypothetical protein
VPTPGRSHRAEVRPMPLVPVRPSTTCPMLLALLPRTPMVSYLRGMSTPGGMVVPGRTS